MPDAAEGVVLSPSAGVDPARRSGVSAPYETAFTFFIAASAFCTPGVEQTLAGFPPSTEQIAALM